MAHGLGKDTDSRGADPSGALRSERGDRAAGLAPARLIRIAIMTWGDMEDRWNYTRQRQFVLGRTAASTRPAAHVSLTDANGIGLSRAVQACLDGMADVIRCRGDSGVHFAGSQGKSCKKYGKQKKILGRGFALRLMEKLRYRCSHTFHNNLPPAQLAALSVTLKYLRHRTMRSKSESLNTQTKLPRTPAIGHKQYYHG